MGYAKRVLRSTSDGVGWLKVQKVGQRIFLVQSFESLAVLPKGVKSAYHCPCGVIFAWYGAQADQPICPECIGRKEGGKFYDLVVLRRESWPDSYVQVTRHSNGTFTREVITQGPKTQTPPDREIRMPTYREQVPEIRSLDLDPRVGYPDGVYCDVSVRSRRDTALGFAVVEGGKAEFYSCPSSHGLNTAAGELEAVEIARVRWPGKQVFSDHIDTCAKTGATYINRSQNTLAHRVARARINFEEQKNENTKRQDEESTTQTGGAGGPCPLASG